MPRRPDRRPVMATPFAFLPPIATLLWPLQSGMRTRPYRAGDTNAGYMLKSLHRVHTLDEIERGALAGLSVLSRQEWTGCTDENCAPIFEGDMTERSSGMTAKVEHFNGRFWFCLHDGWESETRCDAITMHKMGMRVVQARPVP
jgi:hypothetical protein